MKKLPRSASPAAPLSAFIVDDEPNAAQGLARQLALFCPNVRVLGICNTPANARAEILSSRPDVVFLDVQMPEISGIDLLRTFEKPFFQPIFVTGHVQYAIQALRLKAIDYLLKPVPEEDLRAAVERAAKLKSAAEKEENVSDLLQRVEEFRGQSIHAPQTIWLKTSNGFRTRFLLEDIVAFKSEGDYARLFCLKGAQSQRLLVDANLKTLEEKLSPFGFFRVHNEYFLNMAQIAGYRKGDSTVLMNDGAELPVSKRQKDAFEKLLLGAESPLAAASISI